MQVGEVGFLALAAAAFLVSTVCVLPLQETHCTELKDFVEPHEGESREEERQREPQAPPQAPDAQEAEDEESELGELGELSEETDTVGGATSASCQDLSTSVAFANGTLGAVLELKLVFFLLGCVPSVSFTAFYSSMGFFIDRCKNPSFFAQEMLVGNGAVLLGLLLWTRLSASIFARLVLGTFFLFLVDLFMAFPEDEKTMLALGFLQGLLNVTVLSTTLSLASELENCRSWVHLGFAAGTLLPVLAVPFTGFGPKSPLSVRLAYYLLPALFCLLAGMMYGGVYHRKVAEVNRMGRRAKGNLADLVMAYAKSESSEPSSAEAAALPAAPAWALNGLDNLALLLILCYQFAAYFFAGVFPFYGDATAALMLYLDMIAGDVMGNLSAFAWAAVVDLSNLGRDLKERERARTRSLAALAAATCYGALLLLLLIAGGTAGLGLWGAAEAAKDHANAPLPTQLCFVTFFFGAFAKGSLDELRLVGGKYNVVRFARLLGSLLGLLAALLCCHLNRDFSQEISPTSTLPHKARCYLSP
ncbi:SLC22A1 [Symbiodinium sp. CCMP2592]|nr:SLC22A1 [Symbiodinium sp. CCMP2592]